MTETIHQLMQSFQMHSQFTHAHKQHISSNANVCTHSHTFACKHNNYSLPPNLHDTHKHSSHLEHPNLKYFSLHMKQDQSLLYFIGMTEHITCIQAHIHRHLMDQNIKQIPTSTLSITLEKQLRPNQIYA